MSVVKGQIGHCMAPMLLKLNETCLLQKKTTISFKKDIFIITMFVEIYVLVWQRSQNVFFYIGR